MVVVLRATGDAPILKQSKFKVPKAERFAFVLDFLRRHLKQESVFAYLQQSFVPRLDERLGALHALFATDNKLVINYSTTPAWG